MISRNTSSVRHEKFVCFQTQPGDKVETGIFFIKLLFHFVACNITQQLTNEGGTLNSTQNN